jgi:hypothetical protein
MNLKRNKASPIQSYQHIYKDDELWAYYSRSKDEENFMELDIIPWGECLGMDVIVGKRSKDEQPENCYALFVVNDLFWI